MNKVSCRFEYKMDILQGKEWVEATNYFAIYVHPELYPDNLFRKNFRFIGELAEGIK